MATVSIVNIPVPAKRRRKVRKERLANLSLPAQVRLAFQPGARIAALLGAVFGGSIPVAVYILVHYEVQARTWLWTFIAAGLLFSFLSVYLWAVKAFHHPRALFTQLKSVGFALILEGVTSFSETRWLSLSCLAILTFINAVSAAVSVQAID